MPPPTRGDLSTPPPHALQVGRLVLPVPADPVAEDQETATKEVPHARFPFPCRRKHTRHRPFRFTAAGRLHPSARHDIRGAYS